MLAAAEESSVYNQNGDCSFVRFAIDLPISGEYSDPRLLLRLAQLAEEAGWDGCFLWDHIHVDGAAPVADPWIALAAIAAGTSRIRIGPLVTPLFRRHPWKVARETVTLDRLSGGRLIFGAGLGSDLFGEISTIGGPLQSRVRTEMLDEGLQVLTGLWRGERFSFRGRHYQIEEAQFTPVAIQTPRIPIWIGGSWPRKTSFRRAARYEGVVPVAGDLKTMLSPEQVGEIVQYIQRFRNTDAPFDIAQIGSTATNDLDQARETVAPYAAAGATWWLESIPPSNLTVDAAEAHIRRGAPVLNS
jgi:alkanesulfonate monooxygenase SsuD/methylene tetrahydromethanopterin reductase-like flavin-dependent oxidoreductase (luciferase family)